MADSARLRWVTWIVIAGCLAGMALSPRLWTADRSFPVLPLAPPLHAPAFVHVTLTVAFVVTLVAAGLQPRRRWFFAGACVLAFSLILLDVSRLQPWLYLYMFILAIIGCRRGPADDSAAVNTLRMLLVFVYAYSSLHKLNASFFHETGPGILRPLSKLLPDTWPVRMLGYPMPAGELALAALLAFRRTRRWGVALSLAMHTVILLLIGPLGLNYNSVVWPWNLVMPALAFTIFWPDLSAAAPPSGVERSRWAAGARVATILIGGVLPVGGVLGILDRYITWNMYGGAPTLMAVWFNTGVESRLPAPLRQEVRSFAPDRRGVFILDWSMHDLNVAYPELHLMRRAAKTIEPFVLHPGEAVLDIMHEPNRFTGKRQRTTTAIQPASTP